MEYVLKQSLDQDTYTVNFTIQQLKDLTIFLNGIQNVELKDIIQNLGND